MNARLSKGVSNRHSNLELRSNNGWDYRLHRTIVAMK